jgi:hypothetical protein
MRNAFLISIPEPRRSSEGRQWFDPTGAPACVFWVRLNELLVLALFVLDLID